MLSALRPYVDRIPAVARLYRGVREEVRALNLRSVRTPFGFQFAGDRRMQEGSFEPEELAFIIKEAKNADVFVDIGANIGYYTCIARAAGKRVVAIEPLVDNLRYLYLNLAANRWTDVEVFPLGLAATPGLLDIFGEGTGASLVGGWSGGSNSNRRTIPVSTLDIVVGARLTGQRLLIKIDVEGAEHQVLAGAKSMLATVPRPVWLLEVCLTEHHPAGLNPHFNQVFDLFWSNGYEAWTVGGERRVTPADVSRWIRQKKRDFGSHNVVFRGPGPAL